MLREATVDTPDDVVALTECPQRRLGIFRQSPLAWTNLVRKSEPTLRALGERSDIIKRIHRGLAEHG